MRVEGESAFVLHARPWRETSLMVELLTRDHGRVAVVVRGLTSPKRHPLRAAMQPLQFIRLDYLPRGEMARLLQAESIDAAPQLTGDRLMAAFYVHELLLKLTPRNDAAPAVFALYSRVRGELSARPAGTNTGNAELSWSLRRFERDLLDALGVGLPWDLTDDGEQVQSGLRYRLDPEVGPVLETRRVPDGVDGDALRALVADRMPSSLQLGQLRVALRHVLEAHLSSAGLRCWGLLDELARVGPGRQG